ncbi:hypothetical protein RD110_09625 [Rhodoferax koreense]|uniref:Uncharacterized protein n=2 Tax=Rhodoferax koreensis TaxID=1842727 RepID=A0A1P8JUK2_9BURK|nr:hypothetical protein RD110_09625 [Rhodoferax koreense]
MQRRFIRFLCRPQRIQRLWRARNASERTSPYVHDFEAETWRLGLRLGADPFQHHLAMMRLLKDDIESTQH